MLSYPFSSQREPTWCTHRYQWLHLPIVGVVGACSSLGLQLPIQSSVLCGVCHCCVVLSCAASLARHLIICLRVQAALAAADHDEVLHTKSCLPFHALSLHALLALLIRWATFCPRLGGLHGRDLDLLKALVGVVCLPTGCEVPIALDHQWVNLWPRPDCSQHVAVRVDAMGLCDFAEWSGAGPSRAVSEKRLRALAVGRRRVHFASCPRDSRGYEVSGPPLQAVGVAPRSIVAGQGLVVASRRRGPRNLRVATRPRRHYFGCRPSRPAVGQVPRIGSICLCALHELLLRDGQGDRRGLELAVHSVDHPWQQMHSSSAAGRLWVRRADHSPQHACLCASLIAELAIQRRCRIALRAWRIRPSAHASPESLVWCEAAGGSRSAGRCLWWSQTRTEPNAYPESYHVTCSWSVFLVFCEVSTLHDTLFGLSLPQSFAEWVAAYRVTYFRCALRWSLKRAAC